MGVFALVVMGSMAEKITLLVDGGLRYCGDEVTVQARGGAMSVSATPISTRKVRDLQNARALKDRIRAARDTAEARARATHGGGGEGPRP